MPEIKTGLITQIRENQEFENNQATLRKKYNINTDTEKIVVEKSSVLKTITKIISAIIKTSANLALIVLSTIGLFSLVYPNIRVELLITAKEIYEQLFNS
ncbi:MAG: hypothetical protein RSA79_00060 [Oscillospiraceae bacterium]